MRHYFFQCLVILLLLPRLCLAQEAAGAGGEAPVLPRPDVTVAGAQIPPMPVPRLLPGVSNLLPAPLQEALPWPVDFQLNGYTLTAVASYIMTARVIATRYYDPVPEESSMTAVSSVDLGFAWGRMSEANVFDSFTAHQDDRRLYLTPVGGGLSLEEINTSFSNNHIIPMTPQVENDIEGLARGEVVTLGGYLVNITGPQGSTWKTSRTRTDTGDGACEIFLVGYVIRQ